MPRRLLALLAVIGVFAVIACQAGVPAAPPLTDPKEILARTVLSLKDVKTVAIKGELTGTATITNSGTLDLKGTTLDVAADIPAKKIHLSLSAPAFLGTTADVIVADNATYLKLTGPLAGTLGMDPTGKYKKTDVAQSSGDPGAAAADPQKTIDEFKAALDKLPTPPTKAADERCGDQDCYHISLKVTDKDLAAMGSGTATSTTPFTLTIDVWTRKNDLRPAKLTIGVDAGTQGNGTLTFNMTYDQPVTISAPPADQIAP